MSMVGSTYASAPAAHSQTLSGADAREFGSTEAAGACLRVITTEGPHR